jgi:hypothetical protein
MNMKPKNTRASRGETAEEWIARAKNIMRLTGNAAEHAAGVEKAILLRNIGEQQNQIRVAESELTERTGGIKQWW